MNRTTVSAEIQLPSDQDASGRTFGQEESDLLRQVLDSGVLTSTKGTFVKQLEAEFAALFGGEYSAFACSSGTAAIHAAIAAIDPRPGDEIITTPITDMGALTPILYQGAIPVFADVDPENCNVTAASIEERISPRTRAIVATHLFGKPCEMTDIMAVANKHNLPVIEDCAQAFLARHRDRLVGSFGAIGCFSLQQGKHITTGEGGLVVTKDPHLARRMFLYINKAWGYGDERPDHYFIALNYRMSELQGAVAAAQLPKLRAVVDKRIELAEKLTSRLQDVPGLQMPRPTAGSVHVYWKYCVRVDKSQAAGTLDELAGRLRSREIACAPRYIQKPAFQCQIFRDQQTFGDSRFPFTLARAEAVDYDPRRFPGTLEALAGILVLPINENYQDEHVEYIASAIRDAVSEIRGA